MTVSVVALMNVLMYVVLCLAGCGNALFDMNKSFISQKLMNICPLLFLRPLEYLPRHLTSSTSPFLPILALKSPTTMFIEFELVFNE